MSSEIQLHGPSKPGLGSDLSRPTKSPPKTPTDSAPTPLRNPILPTPISTRHGTANKLTLIPLIFLIYFEVAGGPYGAEPAVSSAGPLYALIGFAVFPFIWSVPESLVTAELATALPGNGGFVLWADRAFGPFAGSLMGTWKYLSGVINSAAFPALCVDYLARVAPAVGSGGARTGAVAGFNVALSFLNYTGLSVVGWVAVALGAASLAPFVLMAGLAVPRLRPRRWLAVAENKDWRLFFNTLFWNLNFWDSASTMAGEVERPETTFPRALGVSVVMTSLSYLLPLMAGMGVLDAPPSAWDDGFFADAAGRIAGRWLKYWIEAGAVLSTIGLYEAQLSSGAFQLMGMADLGLLPRFFARRAPFFDTPWVGILLSSLIILGISFMSFNDIVASANFLYSLGMLLEFAAFLRLRRSRPDLKRPFAVPMPFPALVLMCLVPAAFLVFVMVIASWKVLVISSGFTVLGVGVYYLMAFCKARGCLKFSDGRVEEEKVLGEERRTRGGDEV
ncbi:probable polyamine transporter At3g13620 [Ananas comosus]|uniref:Polyamine transporter PUT1 n=2 Tax=Ananas comosus TaxID=4615 RepID=A0A6P5EL06_ANACO|nr:probable polyamine transporter At3g13620 [Ananas comosus]